MSREANETSGLSDEVERIVRQFDIDHGHVRKLTEHFVAHMKNALAGSGPSQIPSYVTKVPDGTEKGLFLAVDLGGTNCRVCAVELHGNSSYTIEQSKYPVPFEVRVNPSYKPLFGFVAQKIGDFLDHHPELDVDEIDKDHRGFSQSEETLGKTRRKLGFTFSFTCHQDSLLRGTLLHWDKGWDIPEALGKDPCQMLQEAIDTLNLPITVTALANDSVGTLMTRAYSSPEKSSTLMGAIFGTGTNAAYIEKLSNVSRLHHKAEFKNHAPEDLMVINTEWGSFDDDLTVLPTTSFDKTLDANSPDPGMQMLEKRVSGLYLGELLRLVIVSLLETSRLDMIVEPNTSLFERESIDSSFLSRLAADHSKDLEDSISLMRSNFQTESVSVGDARAIHTLADAISKRAARLSGAAIAAVIEQSGRLYPSWTTTHGNQRISDIKVQEQILKPLDTQTRNTSFSKFCDRLFLLLRRIMRILGFSTSNSLAPSVVADDDSNSIGEGIIDIGVDGSLIEYHPSFKAEIQSTLRDIFGADEKRVRIEPARDGSGVGAALMAQSATI
ncbi:putative glucokinase [Xylariaceae sp. FL0016]|nr:putative glucokinase [Xylariaceae sp. FL0016]